MKKILISLLLCLVTVAFAYSYEYFDMGRTAYENGRYGQAKEYLQIAIKNKPKNVTYRYYYALSLAQLGEVEAAAQQYQIVAMTSPNSQEGVNSIRALDSLKKYFETKAGDFALPDGDRENYMPYIILENQNLKRWNKSPVNVYIAEASSRSIIENAFSTWVEKSDGILSFNFVPAKDLADITVTVTNKLPVINSEGGLIPGSISIKYTDDNISHADIIIQDSDTKTKEEYSPDKIFATALHMIGHAIGLNTHSESAKDIMYWELTEDNTTISKSDINTMKSLYNVSAEAMQEIHNNPTMTAIKLSKAKDYVSAYPQLPTAWSGLAAAYVGAGNFDQAVVAIQKAIELKPNDPTLYTQLGGFYTRLGNDNLAIDAYKTAFDLESSNKVYLYNWAKACYKSKRQEEARPDVDNYLMGQGFLANDEISRLLRRMYKQDKAKEQEKIKTDRENKKKKIEEMQELEQEMFVD